MIRQYFFSLTSPSTLTFFSFSPPLAALAVPRGVSPKTVLTQTKACRCERSLGVLGASCPSHLYLHPPQKPSTVLHCPQDNIVTLRLKIWLQLHVQPHFLYLLANAIHEPLAHLPAFGPPSTKSSHVPSSPAEETACLSQTGWRGGALPGCDWAERPALPGAFPHTAYPTPGQAMQD